MNTVVHRQVLRAEQICSFEQQAKQEKLYTGGSSSCRLGQGDQVHKITCK